MLNRSSLTECCHVCAGCLGFGGRGGSKWLNQKTERRKSGDLGFMRGRRQYASLEWELPVDRYQRYVMIH
jgi:hypothetical protein